jgi:hypothetical protein
LLDVQRPSSDVYHF